MTLKDLLGDAYKEGMTIDDVTNALAGVSAPMSENDIQKLRNAVTRANGEAAENKRKLQAQQEESSKAELDWQAKYTDLEKRLNAAERKDKISGLKARYLGLGMNEDVAEKTAVAKLDGDDDTLFSNMKAFLEDHDKQILGNRMRNQPQPEAGGATGNAVDYTSQINDAMNAGDMARAAALMRMQQEASSK